MQPHALPSPKPEAVMKYDAKGGYLQPADAFLPCVVDRLIAAVRSANADGPTRFRLACLAMTAATPLMLVGAALLMIGVRVSEHNPDEKDAAIVTTAAVDADKIREAYAVYRVP